MESPTAFSVARLLATYRKTYASVATLPAALFQTRFERPLLSKRTYKCFFRARSFPLSIGMGRVTACALRGCRALSLRSPFSPAQTRAIFFHPADPPIASQSFTRDVRFAQAHPANAGQPFSPTDPPIALQIVYPETRPFPRWRWRDAVCEDPFGRSPGRIKLAEPSSDRAMRSHPR
jgi:hypothetical protein